MFRRREPVPFAFVAEADRFRSNVTLRPASVPSRSWPAVTLIGLTIVAGLVGSLVLGMPALHRSQARVARRSRPEPPHWGAELVRTPGVVDRDTLG